MLRFPRKSQRLQRLLYLKHRTTLTDEDAIALHTGSQGYNGERNFAKLLEKSLHKKYIVLHGILLEQRHNHFQIDTMIIHETQIHLLEIKYFHGDYFYQDNDLYLLRTKKRVKNPFYQLQRCEDLLRDFLLKHKLHYTIHPYVIFNHPTFALYQAPIQMNMVLPTQISRFIQKLNNKDVVQPIAKKNSLVEIIYREHIEQNPFEVLPFYPYEKLKKGILCLACYKTTMRRTKLYKLMECNTCLHQESTDSAVLRSIMEYSILFTEEKINKSKIHEWCNGIVSLKTIQRILQKYLYRKGRGKNTYYEFDMDWRIK